MAIRLSTGTKNRMLGENGIDTGANGLRGIFKDGIIELYTGGQPATSDSAITGTKLGIVTLDALAFVDGIATNGLEFEAPIGGVVSKAAAENWQFKGLATGTIGWARLRGNAADNELASTILPRIDFSVGKGSGDISLGEIDMVLNQPGSVDTFNITQP